MVFSCDLVTSRPGYLVLRICGNGASELFAHEPGGHRWQRVPPTEKRGRKQTSTVTVAVLDEPSEVELQIEHKDLVWKTCRGSGPGGQHRNKVETAVQLTHGPSGLMVRVESEKSQKRNKDSALSLLRARLRQIRIDEEESLRWDKRRKQHGSGMRGDKVRTVRIQDGRVTDHQTGKKVSVNKYLRGELEDLF